jgi:hypothetical protein
VHLKISIGTAFLKNSYWQNPSGASSPNGSPRTDVSAANAQVAIKAINKTDFIFFPKKEYQ